MISPGDTADKRLSRRPLAAMAACIVVFSSALSPALAQNVTGEDVRKAVDSGIAYIKGNILKGDAINSKSYAQAGQPVLGVLALLNAGVPANDPAIAPLLDAIAGMKDTATYVVALKCQVLAAAGPQKYADQLQASADWLCAAQTDVGMWSYGQKQGRGDNSNTQYALLGLHEAAKAGAKVPKEVWQRARAHFENTQLPDGSWTYVYNQAMARVPAGGAGAGYGSMTVAGIASLYICGARLNVGGPKQFIDGAYPSCGQYKQNEAIKKGLDWMAKHFSAVENPNRRTTWLHYYLYGMERVGMIGGQRTFGAHDWYREGAEALLGKAGAAAGPGVPAAAARLMNAVGQKADGSWGQPYDTAFAVLFLAKGNRPVLIQKLQWPCARNAMEWDRNIHDLENFTAFVGDKFGKAVTWQTATLDLPIADLRMSPVLFITGHEFPAFQPQEVAKLRQYVDTGGTLLFEACCGSKTFQEGFRKFATELFPEYPLRALPKSHPVFSSYYKLSDTYGLEAIEVGCRVGVFFSPRALSCLWEMQDYKDQKGFRWSEMAFQLGTNICAYATGKEQLADRLDKVVLAEGGKTATTQPLEIPRGAVRLARLIHDGDYDCDARCLERLCYELRDRAKVAVVPASKHVAPTDEKIFQYPVVFMTGHAAFQYSPEQVKALRTYLDRGGFLLAEACCGRQPFDKSFHELVNQLYPEKVVAGGSGSAGGNRGSGEGGGTPSPDAKAAAGGLPLSASGAKAGAGTAKPAADAEKPAAAIVSAMAPLPADHPLYSGRIGLPLGELRYRKVLADELKSRGTTRPPLEAVTVDGRTTILYSPYDWSCALEGDNPFSCRGYIDEDGKKLALDLVLFAIGY